MVLTTAQKATLKTNIQTLGQAGGVLESMLAAQNWDGISAYYSAASSPAVMVWRTDTPTNDVFDQIAWDSFTPTDATTDTTAVFQNRAQAIQIKQMNLQNMTIGRTTLDFSKAGFRTGLKDALTKIPSGASGANVSAAGANAVNVLTVGTRNSTRIEALFASAPVTTGSVSAGIMAYEGDVSAQTISDIMTQP